jgi:primary-amine oxidase
MARHPAVGLFLILGLTIGLFVVARQVRTASAPPLAAQVVVGESKAPPHPLDPLSPEEISRVVELLRASPKVGKNVTFPIIVRHEPAKNVVSGHKPGGAFSREAFVVLLDRPAGLTMEAVVDLSAKTISLVERKGAQALVRGEEFDKAIALIRADKRWRQAMRNRKLNDQEIDKIQLDGGAVGFTDRPDLKGARLLQFCAFQRGDATNPYPRVIEGVLALVNMTKEEVVEVQDLENVPIPPASLDYFDPKQIGPLRAPLRPLEIKQPQGANFALRGNEVRWQNWSLRHSFHPREGLVLHTIAYDDGGKTRSILYRASMNELFVPYADPSEGWRWRNFFDIGEYGMGQFLSPQRAGHEAPANAALLPVVLADDLGKPFVVKDGLALFERDNGVLWTHTDYMSRKVETRRARQLVMQALYTAGNYDYIVRWIFGQDGAIDVEVDLTGVMQVKGVQATKCVVCEQKPDEDGNIRPSGADRYGALIAPQIVATNHQHFMSFRLDFNIEDAGNSVFETELVPEGPIPANPERNAVVLNQRLLRSEREARRDVDYAVHRTWKVVNPNRKTTLGHFPGYELVPGMNAKPFGHPDARARQRAGFIGHQLWATRYHPHELYAAGDYPNMSAGGDGLPRYSDDNEPLINTDVVLWYTMGVTHASRAEEWPVMPVARAGFRLMPHNFFDRNPALDVR